MRSRGIQAGDVVQVVRDCCGAYVGKVFTVRTIEWIHESTYAHCGFCNPLAYKYDCRLWRKHEHES